MNARITTATLLLPLVFIALAGCSKKNHDTPGNGCDGRFPTTVTSTYYTPPTIISYQYDGNNRLSRVTYNQADTTYFTYEPNKITRINIRNGKKDSKELIEYNSQRLITKVTLRDINDDGSENLNSGYIETYEYNDTIVIRSSITFVGVSAPFLSTYQWADGNLIKQTETQNGKVSSTKIYTYYDQPVRQGDELVNEDFNSYGNTAGTIRNKNLVKSRSGAPNTPESYVYGFDDTGRIVSNSITRDGYRAFVLLYNYTCR